MTTKRERALYSEARARGERASIALSDARTMDRWETLESVELVRFRWIPDDEMFDDSYLETWGFSPARLASECKALWEMIARDGVWGLQGEFRISPESGWESGDAVWGFVGTDRNGYEESIASETMRMLREALKARCSRCRARAA